MNIYALSDGITRNGQPLNPDTEFAPGFPSIFVFYEFSRVNWSASITRVLYRDGELLSVTQEHWSNQLSGHGHYYFFELEDGFTPGEYEIQFFIGETLAARAPFVVREAESFDALSD